MGPVMVTRGRRTLAAAAIGAVVWLAGCSTYSAPQIKEDGGKNKMTPQQAQEAKAQSAEKFSKGYEEAKKRFTAGEQGKSPAKTER